MPSYVRVGSQFRVNTATLDQQGLSDGASLANGNFVITWSDYGPGSPQGRGQIYQADGTAVGTEFSIGSTGTQYNTSVTGLAGGGFVVTWDSIGSGIDAQIFDANGIPSGASFRVSSPGPASSSHDVPDVAALSDGGFAITWVDHNTTGLDTSGSAVKLRAYDANGVPAGGEVLVNTSTIGSQSDPSVTALPNGGYVVTWTDLGASGSSAPWLTKAQLFAADGTRAGTEFLVSTGPTNGTVEPAATTLTNGNFALAWFEGSSDGGSVYKIQIFNPSGTPIGTQLSVPFSGTASLVATGPTLTALSNGGFVLGWAGFDESGGDGAGDSIRIYVFDANAQQVGDPFWANTQNVGNQQFPSIVALDDGAFIVSWTDFMGTADENDDDVYAQIFAPDFASPPPPAVNIISGGGGQTAHFTLGENAVAATKVGATPASSSQYIQYSITGGADAGLFSIDPASGLLSFIAPPNFEVPGDAGADNFYEVVVTATDGQLSDSQTLNFTVTDQQEAVTITSGNGGNTAAVAVFENQLAVANVEAVDPDGSPVTYSISGGADAAKFAIDATTGALSFITAPNAELPSDANFNNVFEVVVAASDGSTTDQQTLAVTVNGVNEGPTITSGGGGAIAAVSIKENLATVTTVAAVDPEGDYISYTIVGGADAAKFTISSDGILRMPSGANYEAPTDAGGNNVYDVVIEASDGFLTDTQAIAVTITNSNEAPVITSNGGGSSASISVQENATAVTTVTSTDPENQTRTYSILGGNDASKFVINATTGALSFVTAPNFEAPTDVGSNNVYNVTVWASDGSNSDSQSLAITVTNVNEAPIITSNGGGATASVTVNENTSVVTTVTSTDPENTARSYSIAGGADAARFTINGTTGALSFISAPNFENPTDSDGNNVYDVIVRASDGSLTDTQAIAVTVTNLNEAPVITSNGGGGSAVVSIGENSTLVSTLASIDPENAALTYAIVGGADAARFTIDAATGALSLVGAPDFESAADVGADNVYDVIVQASDGSLIDTQAIAVKITNVNEVPVITSNGGGGSAAVSVHENTTSVTAVNSTDPEGSARSYSIVGGADAARFEIDAVTGALSFANAPDHETPTDADGDNVYEVIVAASDGVLSDTQTLAVAVDDVAEGVSITSDGGGASAALTFPENSSAVTTVAGVDGDGDTVTYAITGGADASLFTIDATSGELRLLNAPNFEASADAGADNIYDVTVSASDGSFVDTQDIAVSVTNVIEGVAITSDGGGETAAVTVDENASAVAIVAATNGEAGPVAYAIAGGADAARFAIDAATGALSFIAAANHEAPADADGDNLYEVVVSASNGAFADTQAMAVTVGNVVEGIAITSNGGGEAAAISVAENTTAVTSVAAVNGEAGPASYAIVGGADAALFAIDASTGALGFIAAPDLEAPADADGDNVYDVIVSASNGTFADAQTIAITVGSVDEGVTITSNGGGASAALSISENAIAVTVVAAIDGDGDAITYAIAGGADGGLFTIDATSGELSFLDAPNFEAPADAGVDNIYDVVVSASDGGFIATQAIVVSLANVNEGPSFAHFSGGSAVTSLSENTAVIANVSATDLDGDPISYTLVGEDAALFVVDGNGELRFIAAPDFEAPGSALGTNSYNVSVVASDGQLSTTLGIVANLLNENEAISITSFGGAPTATAAVVENATALFSLAASDLDGDTSVFAIAGGADAARFGIDSATGSLYFLAAPDFETPADANGDNTYDVVISASDGQLSDTQALSIIVGNANEGVVITSNGGGTSAALEVDEGQTGITTVTAVDADGTPVVYSITGGADANLFVIDSVTGALSLAAAPDYEAPVDGAADNFYNVIVSASDGELSASQLVQVLVGDVNEALTISSNGGGGSAVVSVDENGLAVTTVVATDEDGDAPSYAIVGGADAARFGIDAATGSLFFLAAPNFEAATDVGADNVYDVVVAASDGQFSDTQALAITVGNANEALSLTSDGGGASASATLSENGVQVTTVAAFDPDGGPIAYSIGGGADKAKFTINATTGALTFLAAPNFEAPTDVDADNIYEVLVQASDGAYTVSQSIAAQVVNLNEAVAISSNGGGNSAAISIAENGTAVTTVVADDPDGAPIGYSIVGGADAAKFAIDAGTGALRFVTAPNFEAPTDAGANNFYDVIVSASDGVLSDTQALAVTITNVNEGATITGTSANNTISTTTTVSGQSLATALEDSIFGLGGADTISSGGGNDIIDGGTGNDTIRGQAGADRLTGGTGTDTFVLDTLSDSTIASSDVITDFKRSEGDRISLTAIDAKSNVGGNQNFTFIGTAAFSGVAGQAHYQQSAGNTFITGDVNGDGLADFQIQLTGLVNLVASDFVL